MTVLAVQVQEVMGLSWERVRRTRTVLGGTGQQRACEEVSRRTQVMQGLEASPRCFQWNPEGLQQV